MVIPGGNLPLSSFCILKIVVLPVGSLLPHRYGQSWQPTACAPAGYEYQVEIARVRSIRLLLVDDNREVLETLTDLLQPPYLIVGALSDAAAVVEQTAALHPEVILLDISLREMTGFEVARRLKQSGSAAKIIFFTVHENVDFVHAGFAAGAAGYVYKSRTNSDLIKAIETVYDGGRFSSAETPAAGAPATKEPDGSREPVPRPN